MSTRLLAFAVGCIGLLSACPSENTTNTCRADSDCTLAGTRCNQTTRQCVCTTNDACEDEEFCNLAGVCQRLGGCASNAECTEPGSYCDLESGRCLSGPAQQLQAACGLATHCPQGAVCKAGTCESGCFDDGDCVLGHVCRDGACASGAGVCSNDGFCPYGQRCDNGRCIPDRRGPYCVGCSRRSAVNPEPCGQPKNFCLENSHETGFFPQFCGVDCSLGQPCPNGYGCNFVVILTEDVCVSNAQCQCKQIVASARACALEERCDPRNPDGTRDPDAPVCVFAGHRDCNAAGGGDAACIVTRTSTTGSCTCASDTDCAGGETCVSGQCCRGPVNRARECRVGESRIAGFCSCATDSDCPQDSCDPSRGACAITGNPCTPGNSGECQRSAIACVSGGCQIGRNCAPDEGLACSDLRPR